VIKPGIAAAIVIAIATTTVAADEPTKPTERRNAFSFSVSSESPSIEYRRMFLDSRLALIAMGGYGTQTSQEPAPNKQVSARFLELGLGLRRNFNNAEQLRPFAQVEILRHSSADSGLCRIPADWNYLATGGGEYFVGRRLSLEASAGLNYVRGGFGCFTDGTTTGTLKAKSFGTFRSAVSVNFYF
jgi:hypothetical protein